MNTNSGFSPHHKTLWQEIQTNYTFIKWSSSHQRINNIWRNSSDQISYLAQFNCGLMQMLRPHWLRFGASCCWSNAPLRITICLLFYLFCCSVAHLSESVRERGGCSDTLYNRAMGAKLLDATASASAGRVRQLKRSGQAVNDVARGS